MRITTSWTGRFLLIGLLVPCLIAIVALWAVVWDARQAAQTVINNPHQLSTRDFYTARVLLSRAVTEFHRVGMADTPEEAEDHLGEASRRYDIFVARWRGGVHDNSQGDVDYYDGYNKAVSLIDGTIDEADGILATDQAAVEKSALIEPVLARTDKLLRRMANRVYQDDAQRIGTLRDELMRLMKLGSILFAVLFASVLVFAMGAAALLHLSARARANAEAAQRRALQASETKTQFLANMSHELRTPLNAICGFAQLMEMGICDDDSDRMRSYAGDISRSGDHLLGVIDTLMDLARIEAEHYDIEDSEFALAPLVEDAICFSRGPQGSLERTILRNIPSSLMLVADRTAILRIVTNLVSNAIKYTDDAGRIEISALHDDTGALRISVIDDGIGVPPDELKTLMTPYARAGNVRRQRQGSGLGLSIAQQLAGVHGGWIDVESTLNVGSTFTLVLPPYRVSFDDPALNREKREAA